MTADEQARHRLHQRLDDVLGHDEAGTLMSSLPPIDWTQLATRDDLLVLRTELGGFRTELGGFRIELDGFRAEVDRRFVEVDRHFVEVDRRFDEVDRRFDALEERLDTRLDATEHHILGEMYKAMRDQTLTMVWANIAQIVALGAIVLAAVKL
jgi:hypothetical protein